MKRSPIAEDTFSEELPKKRDIGEEERVRLGRSDKGEDLSRVADGAEVAVGNNMLLDCAILRVVLPLNDIELKL